MPLICYFSSLIFAAFCCSCYNFSKTSPPSNSKWANISYETVKCVHLNIFMSFFSMLSEYSIDLRHLQIPTSLFLFYILHRVPNVLQLGLQIHICIYVSFEATSAKDSLPNPQAISVSWPTHRCGDPLKQHGCMCAKCQLDATLEKQMKKWIWITILICIHREMN